MNTTLLKQLYAVFSPSGNTKRMRRFLKREISLRGAEFVQDKAGNLFVTKGVADEYPGLAAHIDQVSNHTHPKDFRCIESNDVIMGWSDKLLQQCGLGADDKNGVFICLNALEKFDVLKVAFFVDEEVGCVGSSEADLGFFDDVRFVIEPDRRGGADFITTMCGYEVCSADFIADTDFAQFGYKKEDGSVTDVLTLLEKGLGVSCLNLSCGYYYPHTDQEVTVVSELENCQNLVFHMIKTMTEKYPFVYEDAWVFANDQMSWYDEDFDRMDKILECEPTISFEDVYDGYGWAFHAQVKETLRLIYEDVKIFH